MIVLKSFNEDVEVEFEEIGHQYVFGHDRLISSTEYIKKFYDEFNISMAAARCNWGVSKEDIIDMWETGGNVSSGFGTSIHKALEYYLKFKDKGDIIQKEAINKKTGEPKYKENPALPKHPILKNIVVSFFDKFYNESGTYLSEVFISDVLNGYCGTIDRLEITGDKKCRIQDFKITTEAEKINKNLRYKEPFNDLPKNKLSKYQLQLSFYANILQSFGWVVEGLDIYNYENTWRYYNLEVLKVY